MPAFIPAALAAKLLLAAGPWLARVAALKARLPALGVSAAGVALLIGLAAVAGGVWIVHGWLGDRAAARSKATGIATEANRICTAANQAAEIKALRAAAAEAAAAADADRRRALAAETSLALLTASQEHARNASPNPHEIIIPAGDPWLLRGPFGVPRRIPGDGVRSGDAGRGGVVRPAGR